MNAEQKNKLIEEINKSQTIYHYVAYARELLLSKGFIEMKEEDKWNEIPEKFFVTRKGGAICAINGASKTKGLILSTYFDREYLMAKPNSFNCEDSINGVRCASLYCKTINYPYKLAGRVIYSENGQTKEKLFQTDYPVGAITNSISNVEKHLVISLTLDKSEDISIDHPNHSKALIDIIEKETGIKSEDIVDFDAYFIDAAKPTLAGADKQWISGSSINVIALSLASLHFIADSVPTDRALILNVYGFAFSMYGSMSNFLSETLNRCHKTYAFRANCINCFSTFYSNLRFEMSSHIDDIGSGASIHPNSERGLFTEKSVESQLIDVLKRKNIEPKLNTDIWKNTGAVQFIQSLEGIPTIMLSIPCLNTSNRQFIIDPNDLVSLEQYYSAASEI